MIIINENELNSKWDETKPFLKENNKSFNGPNRNGRIYHEILNPFNTGATTQEILQATMEMDLNYGSPYIPLSISSRGIGNPANPDAIITSHENHNLDLSNPQMRLRSYQDYEQLNDLDIANSLNEYQLGMAQHTYSNYISATQNLELNAPNLLLNGRDVLREIDEVREQLRNTPNDPNQTLVSPHQVDIVPMLQRRIEELQSHNFRLQHERELLDIELLSLKTAKIAEHRCMKNKKNKNKKIDDKQNNNNKTLSILNENKKETPVDNTPKQPDIPEKNFESGKLVFLISLGISVLAILFSSG